MNENVGTSEADSLIAELKPAAMKACVNAHAPYSQFLVGAALVSDDGGVFSGCNVENASFGLTICAERNALGHAVASGIPPGGTRALLIYTPGDVAHSPCGACRQVMQELLKKNAMVISCCDSQAMRIWSIEQLIPDPFEF